MLESQGSKVTKLELTISAWEFQDGDVFEANVKAVCGSRAFVKAMLRAVLW